MEIVLHYIRTNWHVNPLHTDADLTCKLTTLLALTTALRASKIKHLKRRLISKDKDKYICNFNKLHKSWRKVQALTAITYFAFGKDKALCVVEILNAYINRPKSWRESNHEKQLPLSSIRPHNAVVPYTISGSLKKTHKQAGINTDFIKIHWRRFASSSKASKGGILFVKVLKKGPWSHHCTWQRFYNKDIIQKDHVFQGVGYRDSSKN